MAIRTYDVLLDSYNSTMPEPIVGRQGDKNGAVTLHVTITDRGAAVDLTGQTVNLIAETANGTAVVADNDGVTLTDAVNGKFDYAIPNALWSEAGKITKAYFSLNDTDGQQTTYDLIFIVKKAIDISQDKADDYITVIDGTIRDLKTKVDVIYESYKNGDFYSKEESDVFINELKQYTDETVNFRHSDMLSKSFDTAKLRGDFFDQDLAQRGLNVKWYGAVGDGKTDDSNAINRAIEDASKINGTVVVPDGTYMLSSDLIFLSNVTLKLADDAILYGPGRLFRFDSTTTGYNGGVSNVQVIGGTFSGDYDAVKIANPKLSDLSFSGALHHASNIKFDNVTFRMTTANSHTFDLCGCRNIYIHDCTFEGFKPNSGREYVEAIQTDYSSNSCLTYRDDTQLACLDGLPTIDVRVTNCRFLPIKDDKGAVKYYAPNAIGEHVSFASGDPENIDFINNQIVDGAVLNDTLTISGWVHFQSVKNLTIRGNLFKGTQAQNAVAIGLFSAGDDIPDALTQVKVVGSHSEQDNILISNNHFTGFTSPNNQVFGIINCNGNETIGSEVLRISSNTFDKTIPDNFDWKTDAVGADLIQLKGFTSVTIESNVVNNARRLLYASSANSNIQCSFVVKNNMLKNVSYVPIVIGLIDADKSLIDISGNSLVHVRGAISIVARGASVVIGDNRIWYHTQSIISANSAYAGVGVNVLCEDASFIGNIIKQSIDKSFQYPYGFKINFPTTIFANNHFSGATLTNINPG